jgi:SagB-type dehydrogenase family enzyme
MVTTPNPADIRARVDEQLLAELIAFHARARVTSHPRVFSTLSYPGYDENVIAPFELSELSFSPVEGAAVPLTSTTPVSPALVRQGSVRDFLLGSLSFDLVSRLIAGALCARDDTGGRNYPSGGGLFPVEAFLVPLRVDAVENLPPRTYRVRANSKQLEILGAVDAPALLASINRPPMDGPMHAAFAIAYAANLERCIVKYRSRGYRNALVEVGSMIQQVDLCAKHLGLGTVPWAWFDDYEWSKFLGLNPVRLPLVMLQLVGRPAVRRAVEPAPMPTVVATPTETQEL